MWATHIVSKGRSGRGRSDISLASGRPGSTEKGKGIFMRKATRDGVSRILRIAPALAATLLIIGLLAACSGGAPGSGQRLSIATGGTGGVYFVYGGGLAEQITQNLEGFEAAAESTSASVDNMTLIGNEDSDIAFTLADTASDAVEGKESFEEPVPARALAQLYDNFTQVVALEDSGIRTVEDLRGKRVSLGSPNSGTEVIALRILEAAGLDPDSDIERQPLSVEDSVAAIRDGTIDAFFWSGGLPTSSLTDLATSDPLVLLPTAEYAGALQEKYGEVYKEATIPAGTYEGFNEDVPTIAVTNFLVVNESMDEETAYGVTKLLFDRKAELERVHPEAKNLDVERAQDVAPLELHPGAQRYFDEAG